MTVQFVVCLKDWKSWLSEEADDENDEKMIEMLLMAIDCEVESNCWKVSKDAIRLEAHRESKNTIDVFAEVVLKSPDHDDCVEDDRN